MTTRAENIAIREQPLRCDVPRLSADLDAAMEELRRLFRGGCTNAETIRLVTGYFGEEWDK